MEKQVWISLLKDQWAVPEDVAKEMLEAMESIKERIEAKAIETMPGTIESYESMYGRFNVLTEFYTREQIDEFACTVGKYTMSASGVDELYRKLEEKGMVRNIWDMTYEDIKRIPEKYKKAPEVVNVSVPRCSIYELRECMDKYIYETADVLYPWTELGVNTVGELVYLHSDGSGSKLTAFTGADGYPDIRNDRGESVFDYREEMCLTDEQVDEIRGIATRNDR